MVLVFKSFKPKESATINQNKTENPFSIQEDKYKSHDKPNLQNKEPE